MASVVRAAAFFVVAVALAPSGTAFAQDPVRLPGVRIIEKPTPPGPKILVGVTRDTSNFAIGGVEVTIPELKRITTSKDDGSFRFDDMPRGKWSVRARKIGYAAQVRTFTVEADGGVGVFNMMPFARALPSVVTTASRKGLSGRVPDDSGKRITTFLAPQKAVPVREVWNIHDLETRQAWREQLKQPFYSRDDMKKYDIIWVYDLVNMAARTILDPDCSVVVDGGPATANISMLTIDDVEGVEVLNGGGGLFRPLPLASKRDTRKPPPGRVKVGVADTESDNAKQAKFENNAKICALVYVWLR